MDRPGRRHEPRPANRVEALLPAGPAPVDRHRRDPDQQDGLGQAHAGPEGDHPHGGDGVDDGNLHVQRLPQRPGDRAAQERVQGGDPRHAEGLLSRSSSARPTSCSIATPRRTRSSSRCSTRSAISRRPSSRTGRRSTTCTRTSAMRPSPRRRSNRSDVIPAQRRPVAARDPAGLRCPRESPDGHIRIPRPRVSYARSTPSSSSSARPSPG